MRNQPPVQIPRKQDLKGFKAWVYASYLQVYIHIEMKQINQPTINNSIQKINLIMRKLSLKLKIE